MKTKALIATFLLLFVAGISDTEATQGRRHFHHRHAHGPVVSFGFFAGPFWGPWYYPPPYASTVVVERAAPPVYIERGDADATAPPPPPARSSWYYCEGGGGYYPYVKECPGGWTRVPAQPTGQP